MAIQLCVDLLWLRVARRSLISCNLDRGEVHLSSGLSEVLALRTVFTYQAHEHFYQRKITSSQINSLSREECRIFYIQLFPIISLPFLVTICRQDQSWGALHILIFCRICSILSPISQFYIIFIELVYAKPKQLFEGKGNKRKWIISHSVWPTIKFIMRVQSSKQRVEDASKFYIDLYNLPEHGNKEDIVFFLWKALQKCKALIKHTNPISRSQSIKELGCIRAYFRSREETLNCLDLNGIFYGERSFYMKSPMASRTIPQINPGGGLNIRRFNHRVQDGFNKLCIYNLPDVKQYEIINFLVTVGQLKAFHPVNNGKVITHCFFQYIRNEETQACLMKLNNQQLKSKQVSIKRAALMNENSSKTVISKPKTKSILFQKDLHSHYLTFDTVGFFKNMKISCVLLLRNIISSQSEKEVIKEDIKREVEKIGQLIKVINKDKNIYIEYERVEYAQICYLLLMNRKYDGKNIDISFYDPLNFADDILI